MFWRIAWRSLAQRTSSVVLTTAALALSIFVLVGIEHLRQNARSAFARTVAGTDLIVGARTGEINLLLYSVFRIGNASNNVSWSSYQEIAALPEVAWTIPLSLGDSHKGYKVLGTNRDYFTHYRYGQNRRLEFTAGGEFKEELDVVLGAEVARRLGYKLGDELMLAHGAASTSFTLHDDHPFKVVGILAATGTPVDQTLHIDLVGLEAIHDDHHSHAEHHSPESITAFMVGLKSRVKVFQVQRQINQFRAEPLQAILPGVVLLQLWASISIMENTLRVVAVLVLVAALFGMSAMLLASLRERRQEMILLRTVGAGPGFIALLLQLEVLLMTTLAASLAFAAMMTMLNLGRSFFVDSFGLHISTDIFYPATGYLLLSVYGGAVVLGSIPAWAAYRSSRSASLG